MKKLLRAWDDFWFAPRDILPLGIFRFVVGFVLLIMYGSRHFDLDFLFTDKGVISTEAAGQLLPDFFRPPFFWYPGSESQVYFFHALYLVLLALLMLGVTGRLAAIGSLILHLAFMQRNYAVVYGADIVTSFWLLYLAIGDSGRTFSVLSFFRKRALKPIRTINATLSAVALRLIQIQLCLIYGYTGLEKLKGYGWWEGTAVWQVLGNQQIMMVDLSFLQQWPLVVAVMTYVPLLFEIYFPTLVWLRPFRKPILLFGLLFHGMIAMGMGLIFFSSLMVASYLAFADPTWLRRRLRFLPASMS